MIDLPSKRPLLDKICRFCKIPVTRANGIVRQGYLVRLCRDCQRKQSRKYAAQKKKAQQQYKDWF